MGREETAGDVGIEGYGNLARCCADAVDMDEQPRAIAATLAVLGDGTGCRPDQYCRCQQESSGFHDISLFPLARAGLDRLSRPK